MELLLNIIWCNMGRNKNADLFYSIICHFLDGWESKEREQNRVNKKKGHMREGIEEKSKRKEEGVIEEKSKRVHMREEGIEEKSKKKEEGVKSMKKDVENKRVVVGVEIEENEGVQNTERKEENKEKEESRHKDWKHVLEEKKKEHGREKENKVRLRGYIEGHKMELEEKKKEREKEKEMVHCHNEVHKKDEKRKKEEGNNIHWVEMNTLREGY